SHNYATAAAAPPPAKVDAAPPPTAAEIATAPPPPPPPPPAAAAATPPETPAGPPITADADNLATRQVAYNKPKTLTYGEATPVQVVINTNGQAMSEAFENLPGDVKTHNVLVSPEMTAELTGPADRVKIQLRSGYPPWQKVNKLGNPTWIWDVTALAPGMTRVDLAIKAKVDTGATETVIRTYHDSIPVRMGVVDSIKWWIAQIDPIWKWIIGVGTVLGGALLWWRTNMSRKPKPA
ncbi:MAG: hypothetical protein ACREE0_21880, partial [Phenylobacterium sp.]